jgi:hypothetical protein
MPWLGGPKVLSIWFVKTYIASGLVSVTDEIRDIYIKVFDLGDESGPLPEEVRDSVSKSLKSISRELGAIGLRVSKGLVDERLANIQDAPIFYIEQFCQAITDCIRHETESLTLIYVESDKLKTFEQSDLFGDNVFQHFPEADYDIRESGNCLALGRNTACVFHCMRVLEHGLGALAKKFRGIKFNHATWNTIIEQIEQKIRAKKNIKKTSKQRVDEQFYSQLATQFVFFKNAWRNYTAHRQFIYDAEEAERIFNSVREFMRYLVEKPKKL